MSTCTCRATIFGSPGFALPLRRLEHISFSSDTILRDNCHAYTVVGFALVLCQLKLLAALSPLLITAR